MNIQSIRGLEILDSRGNPTVRAFITLDDSSVHVASVPSGASTGSHEACELRDGSTEYGGKSVSQAVDHVNGVISQALVGKSVEDIRAIDAIMLALDGTENKSKLGANAILAVSLAAARAAAYVQKKPLWKFLNEYYFADATPSFPRLLVNVVNGGKHAGWNFDIQEFMVCPTATDPKTSVRVAAEIFHSLGKSLSAKKLSTLVGDEGGYSPALSSNEQVFETIIESAQTAGYKNVSDFTFAVDVAASEFYEGETYHMKKTNERLDAAALTKYYQKVGQAYNIQSFEDPFHEDDWEAWSGFAAMADQFKFQLVGDDLLVTNSKRIQTAIEKKAANALLVKVNQIGSLSETVDAIKLARSAKWNIVMSHRSGETEDAFIADLAYACGAEFIKTGSMSRSDRLAKYNRLLEIEAGL